MLKTTLAAGVVALALAGAAQAQMYHPYNPGHTLAPTTIAPIPFGGGYKMSTPGEPDTMIRPMPFGGGYDLSTPGQQDRRLTPMPFGGGWRLD